MDQLGEGSSGVITRTDLQKTLMAKIEMREAILGGLIGRLVSLHQERLNLGRARSAENVLWSLGVHDVAVFLDVVGCPPDKVKAIGQRVLQASVDDDVTFRLIRDYLSQRAKHFRPFGCLASVSQGELV